MRELVRSNELVFLSWLDAVRAEGIAPILLATHTSVLEGSTLAIPRRVMVEDDDLARARRLVTEAGEGHRLSPG